MFRKKVKKKWMFESVSVSDKRQRAKKSVQDLEEEGTFLLPVCLEEKQLTPIGHFWCDHWEKCCSRDPRFLRGKALAKQGSILDLKMHGKKVQALVQGSELYQIMMQFPTFSQQGWKQILQTVQKAKFDFLKESFPLGIISILKQSKEDFLPSVNAIEMSCSCPDDAFLCKHVAAVLYGIGMRINAKPTLLFQLLGVSYDDFLQTKKISTQSQKKKNILLKTNTSLASLFGIVIESMIEKKTALPKMPKKSDALKKL